MESLTTFIMGLWDEAVAMRHAGVSMEDIQRGLKASVVEGARVRGFIVEDRDLPPWLLRACIACNDSGWEETTRLVRGEVVPAYKRCTCKPAGITDRSDHDVAAKVSSGWKQLGRR